MARYRLAQAQVVERRHGSRARDARPIPKDAPLSRRERFTWTGRKPFLPAIPERAKAIYKSILKEFPFDVEARMHLARPMTWRSRTRPPLPSSSGCWSRSRRTTHLWSSLGETYLRLGEYGHAREALDRYLELKPRDPFGYTILGNLEQLTGDPAAAVRALRACPRAGTRIRAGAPGAGTDRRSC